ncbi:hypothetical protein H2248_004431 [Termitomyces sp. 'cryptogamus']|nr:hypothetical protein H2248_004431 [Termitomyces sp. 'cryptogamus']
MGVEGKRAQVLASGIQLGEYSGDGIVRGIAFEHNWQGGVKMAEDWSGGEGLLEKEEYTLAFAVPIPRGVLLHKVYVHAVGSDNDSEVVNLHHLEGAFLEFGMEVVLLVSSMKVPEFVGGSVKVSLGFPNVVLRSIALSADQVLGLAIDQAGIKDLVKLIVVLILDFDGEWLTGVLPGEGVQSVLFKEAHMEDRVEALHAWG